MRRVKIWKEILQWNAEMCDVPNVLSLVSNSVKLPKCLTFL